MKHRILGMLTACALLLGTVLSSAPLTARAVVPKTFTGCSSEQQTQISDAFTAAKTPLSGTSTYAGALPGTGDKSAYEVWFGTLNSTKATVADVYAREVTLLNNTTDMTVFCQGTTSSANVGGYTWSACDSTEYASSRKDVMVLKVCPHFFSRPLTGLDSRAGVIIHEFSHIVQDTDDHEYTCERTKSLSQDKAINNADSYEYLAETHQMSASCP